VIEKPQSGPPVSRSVLPLAKFCPFWTDNHPVRPGGAKAMQGKSNLGPGRQDASQGQGHCQNEHKPNPSRGSSFIVIYKQNNKPETKCPPSYKFVHPSFCPSIYRSTCPSIHSIHLIDLVVEEGQGMVALLCVCGLSTLA